MNIGKALIASAAALALGGLGTLSATAAPTRSTNAMVGQMSASASEAAAAVSCYHGRSYTFSTSGSTAPVYLNVEGGSAKGHRVITWPWSGGKGNEKWCLTQGPRGYGWNLRPWDNRGLCLDVPGAKYKKGQGLIVWNCNGRKNQDFYIQPVTTDTSYSVLGPWEKSSLKIHRGADDRGSQVSLWPHLNLHAQWR